MNSARSLNWLDGRLLKLQRPTRPWSVLIEIDLATPISAERFRRSLATLTDSRPELVAVLATAERLEWSPTTHLLSDPVSADLDRDLDLSTQCPVRVNRSQDSRTVSWVANHAFTDGVGLLQCVDDFLCVLGGAAPPAQNPVTDDDLDGMARSSGRLRSSFDLVPRPLLSRPPVLAKTALCTRHISTDAIQSTRDGSGCSINDLLVAQLHRSLRSCTWSRRAVAVGVPIDLRRRGEFGRGLGNAVVNANTVTHRDQSLSATAKAVRSSIRRQASARAIGGRLGLIRAVTRPGQPRQSAPRRAGRGAETAVLSNLGIVPTTPHWQQVVDVRFAPPAHDLISVGVATIDKQVSLTFRGRIEPLALENLADNFVAAFG